MYTNEDSKSKILITIILQIFQYKILNIAFKKLFTKHFHATIGKDGGPIEL